MGSMSLTQPGSGDTSPYVELDRDDWARLREEHPMHLDAADVERIRGLGDRLDMHEVEQVYLPISRLVVNQPSSLTAGGSLAGKLSSEAWSASSHR